MADRSIGTDGVESPAEGPRACIRLRFGPADARYGDGLVDGGRVLQLFGDLATELAIVMDGDEGLFRAYESVDFLAPIRAGDFIEAEARVVSVGRTSRRIRFEARRRIASTPNDGPTAARELPAPEVVVQAVGTVVVPAERQRVASAASVDGNEIPTKEERG